MISYMYSVDTKKMKKGEMMGRNNSKITNSRKRKTNNWTSIWHNKWLYLMMLPAIIWVIIFNYIPMGGIVIAFKKFNFIKGIFGSPWNGLDNFTFMFKTNTIWKIIGNTIFLNVLFIITGTIAQLVLALLFCEIKNKSVKKITQSIAILPHFISWAVIAMFLTGFLNTNGMLNQLFASMGKDAISFYSEPKYWRGIFIFLKIWQGAGFGTIVYIAAITGFDQGMYEAAKIDGANRFQQIFRITLPLLKSTIILLTIMSIGNIFRGDFGMIYAVIGDNALLYSTTDVIDTYVYRIFRTNSNLGMSAAVSLFQSIVGMIMVFSANWAVKKVDKESALF